MASVAEKLDVFEVTIKSCPELCAMLIVVNGDFWFSNVNSGLLVGKQPFLRTAHGSPVQQKVPFSGDPSPHGLKLRSSKSIVSHYRA